MQIGTSFSISLPFSGKPQVAGYIYFKISNCITVQWWANSKYGLRLIWILPNAIYKFVNKLIVA